MPDTIKKIARVEDHLGQEIRNFALELVAGDPSSPVNGRPWIDTSINVIKVRIAGSTLPVARLTGLTDADIAAGAAIAISKLATNPLARANHTGTQVAATISDLASVVKAYRHDEFAAPTSAVSWGGQKLTNLGDASAATDAMNRQSTLALRIDQFATPTSDVSLGGRKLTSLADGVSGTDATTLQQVQSLLTAVKNGQDWKDSARVAVTTNVNIANPGTSTLDGVALSNGDRVLLAGQTTASQNGLYVFNGSGSAMTRAADADSNAEVTSGMTVPIEEGSKDNAQAILTTNGAITLGTTALAFTFLANAGAYIDGNGLTLTGSTFDVNVDGATIEIVSDSLRLKDGGVTAAKLATGAVDLASNKVTGTLPITNGGTGATSAAAARTALGAAAKWTGTVTGDGTATTFAATHNLGTKQVGVFVYEQSTDDEWEVGVNRTSTTAVQLTIAPAPANGKVFDVVIFG